MVVLVAVVKEVDRGEPVIVREVELEAGEPIEAFEERLHKVEWEIIVQATKKVLTEHAPITVRGPSRKPQTLVLTSYRSQ